MIWLTKFPWRAACLTKAYATATLLAMFKSALVTTEELPDGYLFRIPGDKKWIAVTAELRVAERECCPFLRFELVAEPGMGPVTVRMTGPSGTKEFLKIVPGLRISSRSLFYFLARCCLPLGIVPGSR